MQSNTNAWLSDLYAQPLLVRAVGTDQPEQLSHEQISAGTTRAIVTRADTANTITIGTLEPQTQFLTTITSSTIPEIWQSELTSRYVELGQSLSEMTRLDADEEWKIEPAVYQTASFVASQLMAHQVPAPTLFNHGSKSVIFNWTHNSDNLYLTISSDKISALISSPAEIKRREQFEARQLLSSSFFVLTFNAPTQTPLVLQTRADSEPQRVG